MDSYDRRFSKMKWLMIVRTSPIIEMMQPTSEAMLRASAFVPLVAEFVDYIVKTRKVRG